MPSAVPVLAEPWDGARVLGGIWPCLLLTHHFSHGQHFWKHFPTGRRRSRTFAPQCFLKISQQMKKITTAVMITKARARWKLR